LVERPDLKHRSLEKLFQPDSEDGAAGWTQPVPSDGRVSLPLLGGIAAAGRAIDDLSTTLTAQYRAAGFPRATVTAYYDQLSPTRADQLRALLETKPMVQTIDLTATGEIQMPLAPAIKVTGLTAEEAGARLSDYYRRRLGLADARVDLILERTPAQRSVGGAR
jgi:protein involved in polysaccharide export with SLBB domain